MDGTIERFDALLCSGARRLTGYQRRLFQAEVTTELCGGSARLAERRFGWGRDTVEKGLHESSSGGALSGELRRTRPTAERRQGPAIGGGHPRDRGTPYARGSGTEVVTSVHEPVGRRGAGGLDRQGLLPKTELPSERTMRDILNRMNYRLKRIQKGKPLKKTEETDAIFANVKEVKEQARNDPESAGDLDGHESEGEIGRLRSWGEKPGPTLKVK